MIKPAHQAVIQSVEKAIFDLRAERIKGPVTFNTAAIHELAETGEFYPIGGTKDTVGGRKPAEIGLAYSIKVGLVVAYSQEEADDLVRERAPRAPKKESLLALV